MAEKVGGVALGKIPWCAARPGQLGEAIHQRLSGRIVGCLCRGHGVRHERRAPLHEYGQQIDPQGAAQLAQEVHGSRAVGDFHRRHRPQGSCRQRGHDQSQSDPSQGDGKGQEGEGRVGVDIVQKPERQRKDAQTGDWKDETDWHNIALWRNENLANYLTKGKQVYIEGRLSSRSYEDKEGQKRYVTEVVVDEIILLGGRGDSPAGGGEESWGEASQRGPVSMPRSQQTKPAPAAEPDFPPAVSDDDVPF